MALIANLVSTNSFFAVATVACVMDVEEAIRERRTHKVFGPEPVDRTTLDELLELARWAPNRHLTNPWRFRVLGPASLQRLKDAAGAEAAAKLHRAPTLVAATVLRHEGCGGFMGPHRTCTRCGALLEFDDVRAEVGPGASPEHPLRTREYARA